MTLNLEAAPKCEQRFICASGPKWRDHFGSPLLFLTGTPLFPLTQAACVVMGIKKREKRAVGRSVPFSLAFAYSDPSAFSVGLSHLDFSGTDGASE